MRLIALVLIFLAASANAATLSEQVAVMAPGTWAQIATENTASDVDPDRDPTANPWHPTGAWWRGNGYAGKWKSWNSGVLAPAYGECGAILYYGGGHNDYWGSDITALDLCTLTWKRLNNPYSASNPLPWPVPEGTLPDGSPVPQHTYDTLVMDTNRNALVTLNAMSNGTNSITVPKAFVFDVYQKQWIGSYPHKGATYGAAAFDSNRGLVWFQPQYKYPGELTSLNPATGELNYYGWPYVFGVGGLDSMMGYDPIRDRLVLAGFRTSGTIAEHSLTDPAGKWKLAEQVNKPTVTGGNTWVWSPQREAWIVWMSKLGPQVWQVKRTGENPVTGAPIYEWTALMDPSNTVTPIALGVAHNPSYDKFQLVTADGTEILIGQLRLGDGVYAFRLPSLTVASVCGQPGVFACDDFNTATRTGRIVAGHSTPAVQDGSLLFTLKSGCPANCGGDYRLKFPAIGEGQFLAFAYRVKADAAAIVLPGRKEFILWRGASSCTDLEIAQSHRTNTPIVQPYTACGARNFMLPLGKYDYQMHYPDYDCTYHGSRVSYEGCVISRPDTWETFYIEVAVGSYGLPNSRITMWHKDGDWKRYIHREDYTLYGSGGFDQFMLTPYMSGKLQTAHPDGAVRYDYIAMSVKPMNKAML